MAIFTLAIKVKVPFALYNVPDCKRMERNSLIIFARFRA